MMALNAAESPISIEHKIHRVQYQYQHHHVHQLLNQQHNNHLHNYHHHNHSHHINHSQALISTTLTRRFSNHHNDHDNQSHHEHQNHHHHQRYHLSQHHRDHQHHDQLEPHLTTKRLAHVITPLKKDHKQQIATVRDRHQQAARAAQKSQIQFFLIAALTYILSPIDLVPEVIFGVFGIIDDILFLFLCMFCIAIILLYPIFREMQRTILDKLGLKQPNFVNKKF